MSDCHVAALRRGVFRALHGDDPHRRRLTRCGLAKPMIASPRMVSAAVIIFGLETRSRYRPLMPSILSSRSTAARFARVRVAFHFSGFDYPGATGPCRIQNADKSTRGTRSLRIRRALLAANLTPGCLAEIPPITSINWLLCSTASANGATGGPPRRSRAGCARAVISTPPFASPSRRD